MNPIHRWVKLNLVLATLFAMDVITTTFALSQGGAELNPFMKPYVTSIYSFTGMKVMIFLSVNVVAVMMVGINNERRKWVGGLTSAEMLFIMSICLATIPVIWNIAAMMAGW